MAGRNENVSSVEQITCLPVGSSEHFASHNDHLQWKFHIFLLQSQSYLLLKGNESRRSDWLFPETPHQK